MNPDPYITAAGRRLYSPDEKRDLVAQYIDQPHGYKGPWLRKMGLEQATLYRWRDQAFRGDVDRDDTPREVSKIMPAENAENKRLRRELAAQKAANAKLQKRLDRSEGVSDALKKAISLLQPLSESLENTTAPSPPNNKPSATRSTQSKPRSSPR